MKDSMPLDCFAYARNDKRQHEKNKDKGKIDKRNRKRREQRKGEKERKEKKTKGERKREEQRKTKKQRERNKREQQLPPKGGNGVCQRHRFSTTGVVA